jgi:glycosyl transferase, family 25
VTSPHEKSQRSLQNTPQIAINRRFQAYRHGSIGPERKRTTFRALYGDFMSLLGFFGAAFVINRPERVDRLRSARSEFARAGWPSDSSGVQVFTAQTFTDSAGFGSTRSRGCFHSHSECIRRANLLGLRTVLVMEDDITLAKSIERLTPSIISQLESMPWDIVYLGHEQTGAIGRATSLTTTVQLLPCERDVVTSHFYAMSSRIFARLLEHLDIVAGGTDPDLRPMPIDGALNVFRHRNPDVRALFSVPKLGWQRPSRSDDHPRFIDKFKPLRPLIRVVREFKHAIESRR